jgi:serine protease
MKNVGLLFALLLFFLGTHAQEMQSNYMPQTVIIKFKPKKLKSNVATLDSNKNKLQTFINFLHPISMKKKFPHASLPQKPNDVDVTTIYELQYSKNYPLEKVVEYVSSFSEVQYAQPSFYTKSNSLFTPDDPSIGSQWYIDAIKVKLAWDSCKGDTNVVIGISDTGTDIFHEEFVNQIKYNWADPIDGIDNDGDGYVDNFRGWDFINDDNNPDYDANGSLDYFHGTEIAGLAAAKTNNKKGIAGVGYNCKFLPIRGSSYEAIMYLADHGASIINCSWEDGLRRALPMYQDIIDYATFNRNALVVCAAGNTEGQPVLYPASYEHAISVGGTINNDEKWTPKNSNSKGGSTYGYYIDACAPAVSIYTTYTGNSYILGYNGTSYSAPIFSGIAGLVKSRFPKYSALQVGEQVRITSDNIDTVPGNAPFKKLLGHGRVNAFKAVTDSTIPSIRLVNFTITGLYDDLVRGGDTAVLRGSFVNYLHKAKNIHVSVTDYNGYFAKVDAGKVIDSLDMMDTLKNFELRFSLKKSIPYDATVALQITYEMADGFRDIQFVTVRANPSYLPLTANNISTSVTSVGSVGYTFVASPEGSGFKYNNIQMLSNKGSSNGGIATTGGKGIYSGLVLAKDTGKVLLNYGPTSAFTTESFPEYQNTDSTVSIISSFNGQYETAIDFNFKINQKTTSWLEDSSFVIYEYDIINTSFNDIDSMYAGLIMDWDVSNPFLNKAAINVYQKYGYVYSIEQDQPYVGVKVLRGESVNHHLIEVNDNLRSIISTDTTKEIINIKDKDGFSKADVFNGLTNSKTTLNLVQNTADDIIQMINVKAKNIKIGDTLHVAFALFVAPTEQNISTVVSRAEYRYKQEHGDIILSKEPQISKIKLIPNITSGNTVSLTFESKGKEDCSIIVTDNQGKIIKEINQQIEPGTNSIAISGIKQNGLYFVTLKLKGFSCTEKFIKQ